MTPCQASYTTKKIECHSKGPVGLKFVHDYYGTSTSQHIDENGSGGWWEVKKRLGLQSELDLIMNDERRNELWESVNLNGG